MESKKIKNVNIHMVAYEEQPSLSEKVSDFFAEMIIFRLENFNLSASQKVEVLDNVTEQLEKTTYHRNGRDQA